MCVAAERRVVHSELSAFGYVFVVDEGQMRYLRFDQLDGDDQSMISLENPDAVPMDYIRYAAVGLAFIPPPKRVLMIGLGGGTFTNLLWNSFKSVTIDAVEQNPVVVRLAKMYFRVPTDERYRIHVADGKAFLAASIHRYDLVFVDAYGQGDDIPSHLATADFFALVLGHLSKEGVAAVNVSTSESAEKKIVAEFKRVFPGVACFRTPEQNLVLVGLQKKKLPAPGRLAARASRLTLELRLSFDLGEVATHMGTGCRP
jgi:spermidine synthase